MGTRDSLVCGGATINNSNNPSRVIAIGKDATVGNESHRNVAIGEGSQIGDIANYNIAIGSEAKVLNPYAQNNRAMMNSMAIGHKAQASSSYSIAQGYETYIGQNSSNSIAIGRKVEINKEKNNDPATDSSLSIAIGY